MIGKNPFSLLWIFIFGPKNNLEKMILLYLGLGLYLIAIHRLANRLMGDYFRYSS